MNDHLQKNNYVVVEEFMHPQDAIDMGNEFKQECIRNYIKPDQNVPNAPAAYMHPFFSHILYSKIFFMNDLMGEKLYPTYAYGRWYKTGSELPPHVDRQECEISVSLNLCGDLWPIYMTDPSGNQKEILLTPGDAVIYRGMKSQHWREKFTGKECVQVFLHYVRIDGPNVLHAFDLQRKGML